MTPTITSAAIERTVTDYGRGALRHRYALVTVAGWTFPVDGAGLPMEVCGRCGGTGDYPSLVDSGRCYGCMCAGVRYTAAHGADAAAAQKANAVRLTRNRRATELRERKKEAARQARWTDADERRELLYAAHPLLADLTYLDNFRGARGPILKASLVAQKLATITGTESLTDDEVAAAVQAVREQISADAHLRPVQPGRGPVAGTILATKYVENNWGGSPKMLLVTTVDSASGVRSLPGWSRCGPLGPATKSKAAAWK